MAQYVTKIRTESGDKQIDYNALANLPKSDTTLAKSGSFADAKATGDAIKNITPASIGAMPNTYVAPVTSVNGKTGAVTVNVPVTSVNGKTGAVTISVPVTSVDGKTGAVTTGAYTASNPPPYPVTSVNGKTGAVTVKVGVSGASEGHLPIFNSNGDIVSSGKSLWNFTRATMSLSGTTLTITTVS